MILADKIINLRKKNGWSQEELANKMDVSRQAVSKWESAQTVPDLQKILQLAELFGVTTDYLLKDEIETEEFISNSSDEYVKTITMEEAHEYLDIRRKASWQIAVGTLLCILSPVTLFILGAASEIPSFGVSEEIMGIVGLAYWGIIGSIFIVWSFNADAFDISWVVFVIGGALFPLVMYICNYISEKRKRTN
jgi:transcriptional regulator with XRE-family HTH domain